jgi:hypothetical protein
MAFGPIQVVVTLGPWLNSILKASGLGQLPLIASNEQQLFFLPKDAKGNVRTPGPSHCSRPL